MPPVLSMASYSVVESFWFFQGCSCLFRCAAPLAAMDARRTTFCSEYQKVRVVKGRLQCPYTKWTCPNGWHACRLCGRSGHGAEECRFVSSKAPPVERPRIIPSTVPPSSAPPHEISTQTEPEPAPAVATSDAVHVRGFGCKGEGKDGNYGVRVPPPSVVDPSDLPFPYDGPASSSAGPHANPTRGDDEAPTPIAATTDDVEAWMAAEFRMLTDLSTKVPPEIGESVLWRGVKVGKHGNPSTKCEWFNGKVRHIGVESGETFLYID